MVVKGIANPDHNFPMHQEETADLAVDKTSDREGRLANIQLHLSKQVSDSAMQHVKKQVSESTEK